MFSHVQMQSESISCGKKPNEGRGTRIMEVVTTDGRIMGKAHPGGLPSLHRYLGETSVGVFLF